MDPETIHQGHRERIRERFRAEGLNGFSEHEVLELLLTFSIPQKDVNPLAHELIAEFGSLSGVLESDEQELLRVPGVGRNTAMLLSFMPELLGYYRRNAMGEKPVLMTLKQAAAYGEALFLGAQEERVYLLCLDCQGHLIHPALLHRGTLDEVALYPREVIETALRYHAGAVLLMHNHPAGNGTPSGADLDTTKTVIRGMEVIGVKVTDHLIFAGDTVFSMLKNRSFSMNESEDFSYAASDGRKRDP